MNSVMAIRMGLAMGDLAAKSVVILFIAWVLVCTLKKSPASTRHLVWLAAFCTLIALPILGFVLPGRALLRLQEPALQAKQGLATLGTRQDRFSQAISDPATFGSLGPTDKISSPVSLPSDRPIGAGPLSAHAHLVTKASLGWSHVAPALLAIWLIGMVGVTAMGLFGLASVWRLKHQTNLLTAGSMADSAARLSAQIGVRRPWELRLSNTFEPPAAMTWGVICPVVLMPQNSASWSQERLEAVLLHEFAHVRRFDSLSQLIAVAASALYWFNPAVWLCARAMRAEAEAAADDTVLRMGIKPSDYARELLRMAAELGHRQQPFSHIGVPVMKQSKIESRVKAILDPTARRRRGVTLIEVIAAVGITTAAIIPLSALRARVDFVAPPSAIVPIEPDPDLFSGVQEPEPEVKPAGLPPRPKPPQVDAAIASKQRPEAREQKKMVVAYKSKDPDRTLKLVMRSQALRAKLATSMLAHLNQKMKSKAVLDEQKLKEELNALLAQSQTMKAQLQQARAELEVTKANMVAQRNLLEQLMHQQKELLRTQEGLLGQRKPEAELREAQMKAQFAEARARLNEAKQKFDRSKKLHDSGFLPQDDLDIAAENLAVARAQLMAAQASVKPAEKSKG